MARIGVMTFLHNDNYGSSLQAYALQRVIREMGHEVVHLDYRPDRTEKIRNLLRSGNHPKLILEGLRKKRVKAAESGARQKSDAFPAFYAGHMRMPPPCRNRRDLCEPSRGMDILVCGSDQIWNPVWLNPAYFLTFAKKQRKIAYAASLGVSEAPAGAKAQKIRAWTADFQAISVREEEGAGILSRLTGKQPAVMPDPVCLLTKEEWAEVAGEPPAGEPYLLCYLIGENERYWQRAEALSREKGLRVLVLPVTAESYAESGKRGYEVLDGAGPEAFLGAIRGAEILLTDSFHGLAFGTIFGVRTEVMRRYRDEDPESKNSRIDHFQRTLRTRSLDDLRNEGLTRLQTELKA